MTTPQLPPLPEDSMTHHITDEQIDKVLREIDSIARDVASTELGLPLGADDDQGQPHAKMRDAIRAVLALAAPQCEPYGWAVTGCHSLYRGEWAESTAQAEARRCGGTAVAFPLYTAPAPAVPSGWKLVPVEPTPEMLAAVSWPECARTDWAHMLTAAPTPPAQPAVPEDVAENAARWVALSTAVVESLSREADSDEMWEHPFLTAFEKAIGDHQGPVTLEQYNAWADAARAAEKGGE